jgi:NTE family protein
VLSEVVDFDRLAKCNSAPRLFLSATNVRTGKIKVFQNDAMSVDVVLASACLPYLFHAVEIDGEHYWDGGFMGNPAIFPLIYNRGSKDVILVHINPIERKKLPKTAAEIFNRMDEISFNSSLMREMRTVAFVTKLIDDNVLDRGKYSRMLIHSIRDDAAMAELGVATKLNPDWDFLCRLRDSGRAKAAEWLDSNFDKVGQSSTVDLAEIFFKLWQIVELAAADQLIDAILDDGDGLAEKPAEIERRQEHGATRIRSVQSRLDEG